MSSKNDIFIRSLVDKSKTFYNLDLNSYIPLSSKTYKCKTCSGKEYIIKKADLYVKEKYHFLNTQGVDNILYPLENSRNEFITEIEEGKYYVMPFFDNSSTFNEIKAKDLMKELTELHFKTAFTRKLSVQKSRRKIEEIINYLNYKFSVVETFVRTVEAEKFDEYSITILKNYQYILDGKKEMIKLNKKVINAIKQEKNVTYCFLHNNPKIDHLISFNGKKYLISLDNGKIGIPSLDIAKFYIENEDLNIDIKGLVMDYFKNYDEEFYVDYFKFLVLLFYLKSLNVEEKGYVTSQSFIFCAKSMQKFIKTFKIEEKKE